MRMRSWSGGPARRSSRFLPTEGKQPFATWNRRSSPNLATRDRHIIALGGGVVLREENRQALPAAGKSSGCKASPEALLARISSRRDDRRAATELDSAGGPGGNSHASGRADAALCACADLTIDAENKSPAEIAGQIIADLKLQEIRV